MKTKNLVLIIALTVILSISSRQTVRAGGPPSSATTGAGTANVTGEVKFEGRVSCREENRPFAIVYL